MSSSDTENDDTPSNLLADIFSGGADDHDDAFDDSDSSGSDSDSSSDDSSDDESAPAPKKKAAPKKQPAPKKDADAKKPAASVTVQPAVSVAPAVSLSASEISPANRLFIELTHTGSLADLDASGDDVAFFECKGSALKEALGGKDRVHISDILVHGYDAQMSPVSFGVRVADSVRGTKFNTSHVTDKGAFAFVMRRRTADKFAEPLCVLLCPKSGSLATLKTEFPDATVENCADGVHTKSWLPQSKAVEERSPIMPAVLDIVESARAKAAAESRPYTGAEPEKLFDAKERVYTLPNQLVSLAVMNTRALLAEENDEIDIADIKLEFRRMHGDADSKESRQTTKSAWTHPAELHNTIKSPKHTIKTELTRANTNSVTISVPRPSAQ